jgi:hypothetical protein
VARGTILIVGQSFKSTTIGLDISVLLRGEEEESQTIE